MQTQYIVFMINFITDFEIYIELRHFSRFSIYIKLILLFDSFNLIIPDN